MSTFENEVRQRVAENGSNSKLISSGRAFMEASIEAKYSYNYSFLGRPIIQYPQDIVAIQDVIWRVRPDLIIEAGIAHGGSLILSASMLALLDYCDAVEQGRVLNPRSTSRHVLGLDIDIRTPNRTAIESHLLNHHIHMIEGSSISDDTVAEVKAFARNYKKVLVVLDSNHTHDHVLAELEAYAPLASPGSYCIVLDTIVEDLPDTEYLDRPWSRGNNPKTAVIEYLRRLKEEGRKASDGADLQLEIDKTIEDRLIITVAPDGYLRRR